MSIISQISDAEYSIKWLNFAKEIVLKNIDKDKYAVFLFGSMVRDPERAYDMDIGILGNEKVPFELIENIKDDLDESIVPYRYDITDFYNADKEFRKLALSNIQIWNEPDLVELK